MVARYWVGGTGTWDASSTTHWSASAGGAAGASAPTSSDNVIVDSASGNGTITVASGAACNNCTVNWTSSKTNILSLSANWTVTGTLTIAPPSAVYPIWIKSSVEGTARTLSAAAVSLANVDFMDITGTGTATWTGTSLGDCGGQLVSGLRWNRRRGENPAPSRPGNLRFREHRRNGDDGSARHVPRWQNFHRHGSVEFADLYDALIRAVLVWVDHRGCGDGDGRYVRTLRCERLHLHGIVDHLYREKNRAGFVDVSLRPRRRIVEFQRRCAFWWEYDGFGFFSAHWNA